MSNTVDYFNKSIGLIEELRSVKSELYSDLSEIKVKLDNANSEQLKKSIEQIFGKIDENDPRSGYITFDMYIECIRILRAAGKAKAESVLDRDFK